MSIMSLIGPATKLLDKFIPDADTKQKIAHELATMSEKHAQSIAPQADTTVMLPVLLGMLGLGTMRTAERLKDKGKK